MGPRCSQRPSPSPQGSPHPSHSPTTSSRTSFQRMWLPVSCSSVTVIRLWIPCQAPGERTRSDGLGVTWGGAGDTRRAGPGSAPHLVEQEGPHARHPAAVVHHRGNVTRRERFVRQGPAPQTHAAPARGAEGPRQGKQPRLLAEVRRSGPEPRVPPCTTRSPADPGRRWDSLAVGLQLTDLEVDQHVVLAVTGPWAGPREGAELGGRHWGRTGEREAAADGRPDLPCPGGTLRKEARGGERVQGSVGTSLPRGWTQEGSVYLAWTAA